MRDTHLDTKALWLAFPGFSEAAFSPEATFRSPAEFPEAGGSPLGVGLKAILLHRGDKGRETFMRGDSGSL